MEKAPVNFNLPILPSLQAVCQDMTLFAYARWRRRYQYRRIFNYIKMLFCYQRSTRHNCQELESLSSLHH